MLVLVTYDVNTETPQGRKRLKRVAKECVNYGHRVQNSVFECVMDAAKCLEVKAKLCGMIDPERDSIRFYYLGNYYRAKVEHFGVNRALDVEGVLMF